MRTIAIYMTGIATGANIVGLIRGLANRDSFESLVLYAVFIIVINTMLYFGRENKETE